MFVICEALCNIFFLLLVASFEIVLTRSYVASRIFEFHISSLPQFEFVTGNMFYITRKKHFKLNEENCWITPVQLNWNSKNENSVSSTRCTVSLTGTYFISKSYYLKGIWETRKCLKVVEISVENRSGQYIQVHRYFLDLMLGFRILGFRSQDFVYPNLHQNFLWLQFENSVNKSKRKTFSVWIVISFSHQPFI